MSLLALELSDAGIMAASGRELIKLDQGSTESPGFVFGEKKKLFLGKQAQQKARVFPRFINNTFWEHLDITALKQNIPLTQNHAEVAYAHLAQLWDNLKSYGNELIIAVPSFYSKEQLGLILGIARELSINIKGLVSLPVAAAIKPCPGRLLLHFDLHLHRFEIVYLKQNGQLIEEDLITVPGKGLDFLYSEWMKAIADEFVRTTRFDPYHTALSEQQLYNNIHLILEMLRSNSSFIFEMKAGTNAYHANLTRTILTRKSESFVRHLQQLIEELRNRYKSSAPLTLQLTHRACSIPGITETLGRMYNTEVIELEQGAGAFGALNLNDQLSSLKARRGVSFLTSRIWNTPQRSNKKFKSEPAAEPQNQIRPTHLLYRSIAYPILKDPLIIGKGDTSDGITIKIIGQLAGVSRKHCSVEFRNNEVILTDLSTYGTYVDEKKVLQTTSVQLGQTIRVGTPGENLSLIACIDNK